MFRRIKNWRSSKKWRYSFETDEQSDFPYPGSQSSVKSKDVPEQKVVYLFPASIKKMGGNKWGYINSKGKFHLLPIYEHVGDFQDNGLAIVRVNNLSGVIDVNGYFIVKPKYEEIHLFSEGRATVRDGGGFKVIDESGKEITAKDYAFIGDYKEGRAVIAGKEENGDYLYGYLNKRGKEVLPLIYEFAGDFCGGKSIVRLKGNSYALISLTGKVLYKYPYAFVGHYGEGLLAFQTNQGGPFGYMNESGHTVIEPKFANAQSFHGDRAIVSMSEKNKTGYGLIDRQGRFIIKPHYSILLDLGKERIALGKAVDPERPFAGSKYAIGDKNGHILTGFLYNSVSKYENGRASAYDDQSTFFIDESGKRILNLPTVSGSGELRMDKTLIQGKIDFRLLYFDQKGKKVQQDSTVIALTSSFAVIEKKYKPNKDFLIYYPEIIGIGNQETLAKVNQSLKDLAGIKETPVYLQLESNYMGDFEVAFFQKRLLVMEITGYNYSFGTVPGMPVKKYAHIDLITGEFYHLKDLFIPGSQYVKMISELIGNQMITGKKDSYVFPGSYKGIQSDQPFFISAEGLNVYFSPHEIIPQESCCLTFHVPFTDVLKIVNQRGSFWESFH